MTRVTLKQVRDGLKEGCTLFFVHASWCPYTVQFYPIFEKVMSNLKGKGLDSKLNVIKLDDVMVKSIRANNNDIYKVLADYDEDIDEYKLYFPTVVMFVNGKRYKYKVDVRTVQNFESFIVGKLSTQSKQLTQSKQSTQSRQSKQSTQSTQSRQSKQSINRNTKIQTDSRRVSSNNKRISTRPVRLLTLQEQIDKAFQKLFK
jgi:thiol-disulfide isomerase/thioredoxin